MTPAVWQPLRDTLAGSCRTIALPLPGHADTPVARNATLDAWSNSLLKNIPHNAILCGWSLGGLLALELARRMPRRISRLILIGTSPRFVSGTNWPHALAPETVTAFNRDYAATPETTLRRFLALQVLGDRQRKTVQTTLTATLDTAALKNDHQQISGGNPFEDGLRLLTHSDMRPHLASIRQPALLIHGERDALMPASAAEQTAAALPDATLHILRECGHAPFLSEPAHCASLIGAFCGL